MTPRLPDPERVKENRLRRMAARQGLRLVKSRRRDERAVDYGRYWLSDATSNTVVTSYQFGLTLEEVEEHLSK